MAEFPGDGLARRGVDSPPRPRQRPPRRAARRRRFPVRDLLVPLKGVPGTTPSAPSCERWCARGASTTTPRDATASSPANPKRPRRSTPPTVAAPRVSRGSRFPVPLIPRGFEGTALGNRLSGSGNDNAWSDRPMAESCAYGHGCTPSDGRRGGCWWLRESADKWCTQHVGLTSRYAVFSQIGPLVAGSSLPAMKSSRVRRLRRVTRRAGAQRRSREAA